MYLKKDKSQIWRLTGIFFAGMLLFTLLSRAAYQHGTAVVAVEAPSSGVITHTVRTRGKAVQNQELAVTTLGGLRVGSVWVNEGQRVEAGQLLFTLDLDYLEETIETQKREMRKQELSIQDAWSQSYATAQRRSNQQAQAEENYDAAVGQAETALERAERTLKGAKKALEDFRKGVTQAESLRQALEQAELEHQAAQEELERLEREIEDAVEKAKQEAAQPPVTPDPPEEADPPENLDTPQENLDTPQEAPDTPQENPDLPQEAPDTPQENPDTPQENPDPPPADAVSEAQSLGFGGGGIRLVLLSSVTPPDPAAIEEAVRQSYAQQLAAAQQAVEQTRAAAEELRAQLESGQDIPGPSEQELLSAVEKAQEAYDDACTALDNTKISYGRSVETANLPEGSNHAAQTGQLTYDAMAQELEKLEALKAAQGEIRSPVEGVVTGCRVRTGEKTTDTTAVLLADLSRGCKFTGEITQEQSQYIGVGDLVTLQGADSSKRYQDLPVTLLAPGEEGKFHLAVQLPESTLTLGAAAELTFTRRSQPYGCCISLSALRLDEKNQPYVLVAEDVNTVLGLQAQARKVPVTVLERNDVTAALADGALHREQKVIVSADRAIEAGSRIRVG